MDYAKFHKAAYDKCNYGKLSTGAWALYSELFSRATRNDDFTKPVQATNENLMISAGIGSILAFLKYRQELIKNNLIIFIKGSHGKGRAAKYKLTSLIAPDTETRENKIKNRISYEKLLKAFQKYVNADMEATADPKYIRTALELAGIEPEDAKLLGFSYLYDTLNANDYTIEWCPYCNNESYIHATGITPCGHCGKPLAPCSVCRDNTIDEQNKGNREYQNPCETEKGCPYGCQCDETDEFKKATMPPLTKEEIQFCEENL